MKSKSSKGTESESDEEIINKKIKSDPQLYKVFFGLVSENQIIKDGIKFAIEAARRQTAEEIFKELDNRDEGIKMSTTQATMKSDDYWRGVNDMIKENRASLDIVKKKFLLDNQEAVISGTQSQKVKG